MMARTISVVDKAQYGLISFPDAVGQKVFYVLMTYRGYETVVAITKSKAQGLRMMACLCAAEEVRISADE